VFCYGVLLEFGIDFYPCQLMSIALITKFKARIWSWNSAFQLWLQLNASKVFGSSSSSNISNSQKLLELQLKVFGSTPKMIWVGEN